MGRRPETVTYRWSNLPEQREWMLAHAGGRPIADVCADFERKFGTPINKTQVSLFRAEYGLPRRRGNRAAHDWHGAPVGAEREANGYVMVKVRELPSTPRGKDNWAHKHRLVWERAHGEPVPPDCMVMFADGDKRNFDPENLVAVPRACVGPLNAGGLEWHDAETLRAAVALVTLRMGVNDALNRPRRCAVCGREFTPDNAPSQGGRYTQRTCRDCLDRGLRAPKRYHDERTAACAVCGREFTTAHPRQIYCSKKCQTAEMRRRRKEEKSK